MIKFRILYYGLAFLIPPALAGMLTTVSTVSDVMIHRNPEPLPQEQVVAKNSKGVAKLAKNAGEPGQRGDLTPKAIRRNQSTSSNSPSARRASNRRRGESRPTAVILLSNAGTELTDFLAPYEILSATERFHVVTAAPEKILSPTNGPVSVIPDLALKDAPQPDLLVIPAIMDPQNPQLIEWIRLHAPKAKLVLSLSEGTRLAAQAGLLKNRNATSHFMAIEDIQNMDSSAHVLHGVRYILDGNLLSSVGISAALDATLVAIERVEGYGLAERTANLLGQQWKREGNPFSPAVYPYAQFDNSDWSRLLLSGAFTWGKREVGVTLYPGVSEIGLAAALETFPRSFSTRTFTAWGKREVVPTRFGAKLVPTRSWNDSTPPDLWVIPSNGGVSEDGLSLGKEVPSSVRALTPAKDLSAQLPGRAFDLTLNLLSEAEGDSLTQTVAKLIGHSWDRSHPSEVGWDSKTDVLIIHALVLGILGVAIAWLVREHVQSLVFKRRTNLSLDEFRPQLS